MLSDSPDSKAIHPDAPLLAGYPLPSRDFYVLAMTWPAPDIPRPGCVWTHSLLLPAVALGFANPIHLLNVFRRPSAGEGYEGYGDGLQVKHQEGGGVQGADIGETVLWALYEPPSPPIDLRTAALAGVSRNEFLLGIWAQLWPDLRMEFSFAVAPSTARRVERHLFDLQITERPQSSSWEQRPGEAAVRTIVRPVTQEVPPWCSSLALDFEKPDSLREFLWNLGPTLPPSRIGVWVLAILWATFSNGGGREAIPSALSAISRAFPEPSDAADLKQALLGPLEDSRLPFKVQQDALFAALAMSDFSLDDFGLELERRSAELADQNPQAAQLVAEGVLSQKVSRIGKEILSGIGAGLPDKSLRTLASKDLDLLTGIARHSDPLQSRSIFWSIAPKDEVWPVLSRPRAARLRRKAMLRAILQAKAEDAAQAAVEDWGDGVDLLFELVAAGEANLGESTLVQELPIEQAVSWLKANGPCPPVSKTLLENWRSKQLGKLPVAEWKALFDEGEPLSDLTLVLLFAACTDRDSRLGPQRAVAAYEELFERISNGNVKKKALRRLAKEAEARGVIGEDPLETVTILLASGFEAANWSGSILLQIEDEAAFQKVLEEKRSSAFLEALTKAAEKAQTRPGQRDAIFQALMETKDPGLLQTVLDRARRHIPWLSA
jgi:hypothetical protein